MADDTDQGIGAPGARQRRLRSPIAGPVHEGPRQDLADRFERIVRIALRPIAGPMPLGFVALAGATTTLGALQLGWMPEAESRNVALVLLAFVFPLQLVASVFGTLARDGVAATAMGILAGTWLSVGLVMLTSPAGSTSDALGVLLFVSALGMLVPASAAGSAKLTPAVVLTGTFLRFATAGIFNLTASRSWERITGWVGIALAVVALYAALAAGLEEARGRTVLPMGRRRRGREALEGGFAEQILEVAHEPGVRRQL